MHRHLMIFAGLAWVFLVMSAIAQTYTTESIARQIPNKYSAINELSALQIFDSESDLLEISRGVIMQGIAGFSDQFAFPVEPNNVRILRTRPWYYFGVKSYCIQVGGGNCAVLHLPPEQVERLFAFVKNRSFIAFSLPGNAKRERVSIVKQKLSNYGLVPTSYNGREQRDDWIASELNNKYFARVFRLVDFDPPPFVSDRDARTATDIQKQMNTELGHETRPSGRVNDSTWLNVDLHALFVGQVVDDQFRCHGLPARYTWGLMQNQRMAYIAKVEFAREPKSQSSYVYHAHQTFCITAVLRRLWNENAEGVSAIREFHG